LHILCFFTFSIKTDIPTCLQASLSAYATSYTSMPLRGILKQASPSLIEAGYFPDEVKLPIVII